jgi:hypothetical protein
MSANGVATRMFATGARRRRYLNDMDVGDVAGGCAGRWRVSVYCGFQEESHIHGRTGPILSSTSSIRAKMSRTLPKMALGT